MLPTLLVLVDIVIKIILTIHLDRHRRHWNMHLSLKVLHLTDRSEVRRALQLLLFIWLCQLLLLRLMCHNLLLIWLYFVQDKLFDALWRSHLVILLLGVIHDNFKKVSKHRFVGLTSHSILVDKAHKDLLNVERFQVLLGEVDHNFADLKNFIV